MEKLVVILRWAYPVSASVTLIPVSDLLSLPGRIRISITISSKRSVCSFDTVRRKIRRFSNNWSNFSFRSSSRMSPVRFLLSSDLLFERNLSGRTHSVCSSSHWLSLGIASNECIVDDSRCLSSLVQLDQHADLLGSKWKYLGLVSGSSSVHRNGRWNDRHGEADEKERSEEKTSTEADLDHCSRLLSTTCLSTESSRSRRIRHSSIVDG